MLTQLYAPLRDAGLALGPELEEAIAELNKFYTVSRYPDAAGGPPSETVTRRDSERSLETARAVVAAAEELLIKLGYGGTPGSAKRCE